MFISKVNSIGYVISKHNVHLHIQHVMVIKTIGKRGFFFKYVLNTFKISLLDREKQTLEFFDILYTLITVFVTLKSDGTLMQIHKFNDLLIQLIKNVLKYLFLYISQ